MAGTTARKKILGFTLIFSCVALLGALALRFELLREFESRSWDWRLEAVAARTEPDPAVRLIVLDQGSLDHFAREEQIYWQWPRGMYEPVVRYLREAGARGVAFDILFTEPSAFGVDDDAVLAQSLSGDMPVVLAAALRQGRNSEEEGELARFRHQQREWAKAREVERFLSPTAPRYGSVTLPVPELLTHAAALGNVASESDSDGIYRHAVAGGWLEDVPMLSLPFALFSAAGGSVPEALDSFRDPRGLFTVRFSGGSRTYRTYPIDAVIRSWQRLSEGRAPLIDPAEFRGSYVFVGMVAPGLLDLRPTPLARDFPGVEFNATVFDNLRNNSFIRKLGWAPAALVTALAVGLVTATCLFVGRLRFVLPGLGALFLLLFAGSFQVAVAGWWVPLVIPAMTMVLAALASLSLQYQLEGRQHRFIKDAFRHYVSPSVIDRIVDDPSTLTLGGEKRELTIFFSDIAGFTTISEKIEAAKLVPLLNTFLTEMTDIILKSGGTVDKYVGDAIVAFWNAPVPVDDHAERAVRAALRCQERLGELSGHFEAEYGVPIRMRIGLHTGTVSVGNFGSRERFNYTVIGDAANLASRLEGANKNFGTLTLLSASTLAATRGAVVARRIADIKVVGKEQPVTVYEPLWTGSRGEIPAETHRFNQGLAAFDAGNLDEAELIFRSLTGDPAAKAYGARIERDRARGAPADGWSPVWSLSEK